MDLNDWDAWVVLLLHDKEEAARHRETRSVSPDDWQEHTMGIRPTDIPRVKVDRQTARALHALRLCEAYANPLRHGLPLSTTESDAVRLAVKTLKGTK